MKIIHTSDWHIGQTFYEHDRWAEHADFFEWLLLQVMEREADVVLIAGDVFDTANPSAVAQRNFYYFLDRLSALPNAPQVVITSGNHDSGARLQAPQPLLESRGITVCGFVGRTLNGEIDFDELIVPLRNRHTKAIEGVCLAVPFLRQGDYPVVADEEGVDRHAAGIRALYAELIERARAQYPQLPIVAMGHLQALGASFTEGDGSERKLIGGLDSFAPDAFDTVAGVAYTALGHIHKKQQLSGRPTVRYCGSPLPMSFAEKGYKHGVTLVELTQGAEEIVEELHFEGTVKLISLPKGKALPKEKLLALLKSTTELHEGEVTPQSPYLELRVMMAEPDLALRAEVDEILAGKSIRLCLIRRELPEQSEVVQQQQQLTLEQLREITPTELAGKHYQKLFNKEMSEELTRCFQQACEDIEQ